MFRGKTGIESKTTTKRKISFCIIDPQLFGDNITQPND